MSAGFDRRRCLAMMRKEMNQILRDPSTLVMAFFFPLLLLFIFGYGVSLDTARLRIGVALEDSSEAALSLANAYQRSPWFDVRTTRAVAPLKDELVADRIRGIVVIPADFGRRAATRQGAEIQVITDGSLPQTATFVAAYAEGVRANWAAGRTAERGATAEPPIALQPRLWFNPELTSRWFLVPGSIAIVMTMIGTLLTALVIAREWERGTMEAIMATPLGMGEFLISKIVPYFLLALGSMTLCTLIAIFLFGMPFRGSVFALFAIVSCFLTAALGQGLMISAAIKNQFVASQLALLSAFLPSLLLSGFLFEISSMPKWIQVLTYFFPARYLIAPLQTVFIVGDVWPLFLRDMAMLLLFGAIFLALAFRATRRRIA